MYATLGAPKLVQIDPAAHEDPFYRYKMPQLAIIYVGGKTQITNMDAVTKALKCGSTSILKYLSKKLGVRCSLKISTLAGIHTCDELSVLIEKFIVANILCPHCGLPELNKDNCNACGTFPQIL